MMKLIKALEDKREAKTSPEIYGDLLDTIISRVPLLDLLQAYHVSKDWRCAVVTSASNPSRAKPWLLVHIQSTRNPSLVVTRAYDPETRRWIEVPCSKELPTCLPLRSSSNSNLIYTLTPSKLSFSLGGLNAKWHVIEGPKIWRVEPIVVMIGSDIVVAGGSCDFEDDPLAVEIYNSKSAQWEICQSIPDILEDSSAATYLSVAVSEEKLFMLEKSSGTLCVFDPETKTWGTVLDIRPDQSISFSLIGFVDDRLVLVGVIGDANKVESLKVWEVNRKTFSCSEIGKMPTALLQKLKSSTSTLSSLNVSMASGMIYFYNSSEPKEIIACELFCGTFNWESLPGSLVNDNNLMQRFVVSCSNVGFGDLQTAFGTSPCKRK